MLDLTTRRISQINLFCLYFPYVISFLLSYTLYLLTFYSQSAGRLLMGRVQGYVTASCDLFSAMTPEGRSEAMGSIPLGRFGEAPGVADAALFFWRLINMQITVFSTLTAG